MHKSATKCNKTLSKWCKSKHGASKIMDTLETYHTHAMGVDRVEDSEDLDIHSPSSDDDDGAAIVATPLDSHPPRMGKKVLPNFGLDAS
jgi:hypothetical protein